MPHEPDEKQVLTPPKTRVTNAWALSWQRYYGIGPRGPLRVQREIIPAMKRLGYKHRVRR